MVQIMFRVYRSGVSAFIITLSDLRQSFMYDLYMYTRIEFLSH